MEAKDTLLNALNEAKQVGQISSLDVDNLLTKLTDEAKQAGIKEVVEWINTHTNFAEPHPFGRLGWQDKIKDWGIK